MKRLIEAIAARVLLTVLYGGCLGLCALGRWFRLSIGGATRSAIPQPGPFRVMAIGTFYTRNWCLAHLLPLSRSAGIRDVTAIVEGPIEPIDGVRYVRPSRWLSRLLGRAFAKSLAAIRESMRQSQNVIVGYHLVPNGVIALVVASWFGARAAYQVTGGPVQLIGGGAGSENPLLRRLGWPSPWIERLAMSVARKFDLCIVRGSKAQTFLVNRGIGREVRIIPGCIDARRFAETSSHRPYDLITVGRLVPVKQLDQFLEVVRRVKRHGSQLRALIVGDGPERTRLESLAASIGVADVVQFVGHVDAVETLLKQSKVFLLTSQSEGLSIAMAEAMAAGVVPVVADVGDLAELVRDGVTGRLIPPGNIDAFADAAIALLEDGHLWNRMSQAAVRAVLDYNHVDAVAGKWSAAIESVCRWPSWAAEPTQLPKPSKGAATRRSAWKLWESTPPAVRNALSHVVGSVPPEWILGRRFRRWLAFVQSVDRLPPDQARAYATTQVQRICRIAYQRSSFYRSRFDECGLAPETIRCLDDLRRLPTIDRTTVREHLNNMLTVPAGSRGTELTTTGGTSGSPLRFYIGTDRSAVEYAHLVAAWARRAYRPAIAQAVLRGRIVSEDRSGLRHEYDPILRRHYYSTFHMSEDNIGRYLEHIATIGPCFLHVYPSSLDMLSRFLLKRRQAPPPNIQGILAGSEIVYPENRARAEKAFGVPYFSWYGHTEKLVFAAECEHSSDYHVYGTYGLCELLDADGQPITEPGQRGEIVGTGFINTVVPFIRYRTGDYATFVADRCDQCGRSQLILRDIRGHRTQELLVGSDGALIPWTALNMHDDTFDGVRRFQFLQTARGRATLRVVPDGQFRDEHRRRITESLRRKLQGNLAVDLEVCEDIQLTSAGKTTYVDQRIPVETEWCGAGTA